MTKQWKELSDYFSDAINASGKALVAITCFLLTLIVTLLDAIGYILRAIRKWFESGCKINYPKWMLPTHKTFFEDNP